MLANLIGNICILGNESLNPVEEILILATTCSGIGQGMNCSIRQITYEQKEFYLFVHVLKQAENFKEGK